MNNEQRLQKIDDEIAKAGAEQADSLVFDFDAAVAEWQKKTTSISITFRGRQFDLPSEMPAAFQLFYARHCIVKRGGKTLVEVPDDKAGQVIELMFGAEFLDFVETQPDVPFKLVFEQLVGWVLHRWGVSVAVLGNGQ